MRRSPVPLIRNPNYAERNVPICLLSELPLNPAISWLFLGYFLVLFAERVQSLARICRTSFAALYRTGFDGFVDTLTVLSLVATVLLLAFGCRGYWQSLVNPAVIPDYSMLTVTAGVMLVSGMMHTEYTVAPVSVRFVRYADYCHGSAHRADRGWRRSSRYVLVLARLPDGLLDGNPVMYRAEIAHATLFHVIEAIVALALVACFTWMLRDLFRGRGTIFCAGFPC